MPVLLFTLLVLQSPAERADIERLRDSLTTVRDTVALARLETATIEIAKQRRDDALLHLRLGFIAYRLGELTDAKPHYDAAAGEFEWASELQPGWPYAWYGLGLSELALGEHGIMAIENIRQMLGKDFLSKAAHAFARAAEADPSFASAVVDLANTALTQRIRPRLEVALSAVRMAASSPAGRHAEVQLVRGRVEREAGESDSALAAFREYLTAGGDSGIGLLELGRTAYLARQPGQGWVAYLAGARAATSEQAIALYRGDLGWIADSADLKAFDALPDPAARGAWLEAFWARRDVREAREPGERLAEHYRRWFHARRSFRLVSRHRHYDITERYRSAQAEFDDRGVIYLRHGEPDRRARLAQVGVEPNESWMYDRPGDGADLIFHFVARDDASDFKLVESLADVLGFSRAVRAGSTVDPSIAELYTSRIEFGALYGRVGRSMRAPGRELAEDRERGQRSITTGTTSDSYARRFEEPLEAVVSDFVVGGTGDSVARGSGQTLHVVFAIPAGRLPSARTAEGTRYPLRFRLVVSDAADRPVATLDTLRVFASREPLRAPAYLTGRLALPLSAGRYRYRFLVTSPDESTGDLVIRDSLAVDALDGGRFAVSDVVVGREGSGLVWNTVPLNPLQRYPEGSAAELYYEVYGLAAGATYHTVVRLEREGRRGLFGGRRAPVLLEFDAPADGPRTQVRRGIALRDVSPGNYRLTVVISDPASGTSVTRAQRFQVVSR
ncbi:MAG: GWxTD domain-containing protein [Gemmatimonadales bacterium]|nr:GWxTD domain-containing protein [Gemmatimonadales bacterium]